MNISVLSAPRIEMFEFEPGAVRTAIALISMFCTAGFDATTPTSWPPPFFSRYSLPTKSAISLIIDSESAFCGFQVDQVAGAWWPGLATRMTRPAMAAASTRPSAP